MPLFSFEGKRPTVHPTAFVAPTAVLVGDVTVEANASVWYNAVLRADFHSIVIRRGANVQDCAVVHVTPYAGTAVGSASGVGWTVGRFPWKLKSGMGSSLAVCSKCPTS